jgi:hypothetical protein
VDLYLALGGGFDTGEILAGERPPEAVPAAEVDPS